MPENRPLPQQQPTNGQEQKAEPNNPKREKESIAILDNPRYKTVYVTGTTEALSNSARANGFSRNSPDTPPIYLAHFVNYWNEIYNSNMILRGNGPGRLTIQGN